MKRLLYLSLFCIAHTLVSMDALWIDEEDQVSISPFTNAVHQRYYFIARLEPVHVIIESLHCTSIVTYQDYQALSQIEPRHFRIIQCIEEMQEEQTCVPLLELWGEVCVYKYITDEQFIKEYTALVCVIAHQLVTQMHDQLSNSDQKTLAKVIDRAPGSASNICSYDVAFRYYLVKRLKKVGALFVQCAYTPCQYSVSAYLPGNVDIRISNALKKLKALIHLFPS